MDLRQDKSYQILIQKLKQMRRHLHGITILNRITLTLAVLLGIFLTGLLLDKFLPLPAGLRVVWLGLALLGAVVFLTELTLRLLIGQNDETIALLIERHYPEVSDRLISSIQLAKEGSSLYSLELIRALLKDTEERLAGLKLSQVVSKKGLARSSLTAGGLALGLMAYGLLSPLSFYASAERFLHPFKIVSSSQIQERKAAVSSPEKEALTPPVITRLQLRYEYPAYTQLPPLNGKEGEGHIETLVGTKVTFRAEADHTLKEAYLALSWGDTRPLFVKGNRITGQMIITRNGEYTLQVIDTRQQADLDPVKYQITALQDNPPQVKILEPAENISLPVEMVVPLRIEAEDDYGLTHLNLRYKINRYYRVKEEWEEEISLAAYKPPRRHPIQPYTWDLNNLGLLPEDVIIYYAVAMDSKGNKALSPRYAIRFPSMAEIYKEIADRQKKEQATLADILEEQKQIKEATEKLLEEIRRERELSVQDKENLKELSKEEEKIVQKAESVLEQMTETLDQMEENQLVSPEVMEKIQEIQDLIKKVVSEEMKEAMKRLSEAVEGIELTEQEEKLMQATFNQEEFIQRLDRTLSLLKRMALEQSMETAIKEADEILKRQEEITEQTLEGDKKELSDLAKVQEALARRTEELLKEIEQMAKEADEMEPTASEALKQAAKEAGEIPQKMQQTARDLSAGQREDARVKEQDLMQKLSQLSAGLSQAKQGMRSCQLAQLKQEIDKALGEVLNLSGRQEEVLSSLSSRPSSLKSLAAEELLLKQGVEQIRGRMEKLAKKSLMIPGQVLEGLGQASQNLSQTADHLEEGKSGSGQAKEAMYRLNQVAVNLMKTSQKCSQCQGSCDRGGGMEQLSSLGKRQQGINKGTDDLLKLFPDLTRPQGKAMAKQLAYEQSMVRQGLERLLEGRAELSKLLGRLDELGKEMENIEEDLGSGSIKPETKKRQQQVLKRLLDATKSIHQKELSEKEREAERPKEYIRRGTPGALPDELTRRPQLPREKLPSPDVSGITIPGYEELIKQYFRFLSEVGSSSH
ncbi:MAG: DUF4175 family protein [bacterium]